MKAKLRNQLTGQIIPVESTTNHPTSSYGKEVWVAADGQAFGQVGLPIIGFSLEVELDHSV